MPTINEILKQCQSLWETLLAQKASLDSTQIKLDGREKMQGELQEKLDKWNSDLTERETATAKIESVVNLNNENKTLDSQIAQQREKLVQETQAYNEYMAKSKSEIEIREKSLASSFTTLREEQEKLKKDLEDLAKKAEALQKGGAFLKIIDDAVKASK